MKGIDFMTKYVIYFWDMVFGEEFEDMVRNTDGSAMLFDTKAEAKAKAKELADDLGDYYVDVAPRC